MKTTQVRRSRFVFSNLLFALALLLAGGFAGRAQTLVLSNIWNLSNTNYPFLTNDNNVRGFAFNPATSNLLVVSRTGSNAVHVLSGRTVLKVGDMNMGVGVFSGGTFVLSLIGTTDDGVIYTANLTTDSATTPFRLYRWAGEDATNLPVLVYSGDVSVGNATASNRRFGDNLDVRGSGTNTQILVGSRNGTLASVLTTTDGTNFTATAIATDAPAASFGRGVAWGPTNTFYGKDNGTLRRFSLNLAGGTATTLNNLSALGTTNVLIGFDVTRNLLATVDVSAGGRSFRVFDMTDPASPVLVGAPTIFPLPTGANGNGTGGVDFGGGAVYGLSTAIGIVALDILVSAAAIPPSISAQPAGITAYDGGSNMVLSVGASGTAPFSYRWFRDDVLLPSEATNFIRFNPISAAASGAYQVIVTNLGGAATSVVATVTVLPTLDSALSTNVWRLLPGSRPYLSDSDNSQRSIAFSPATTNLLVMSRAQSNAVIVLDGRTGAEKAAFNMDPSVISGGTFAINQLGVSADGVVIGCNLTLTANNPPLNIYRWDNDSGSVVPQVIGQHDPGATIGLPSEEIQPGIRWGDAMSVRGAFSNGTFQVLLAPSSGTNVALLVPDSGGIFSAASSQNFLIRVSGAPAGFAHLGINFGPGTNTFWAKGAGSFLRLVEFDLATRTGVVTRVYTNAPLAAPLASSGVAYDHSRKLLSVVGIETPDNLRLYDVSDLDLGPVLRDQKLFAVDNPNINNTTATAFGAGYLYALSANNGVFAIGLNDAFNPGVPVFALTNQFAVTTNLVATNNSVIVRWPSIPARTYRLESKDDLSLTNWTPQTILSAPATTTIVTNVVDGVTNRFYRVKAL